MTNCRNLQDTVICRIRDTILSTKKYDAKEQKAFSNRGTIYLTTDGFNVVKWIKYDFQYGYCSFKLSDGQEKPDKLRFGYIDFDKNQLQPALTRLERWIKS